MKIILSAVMFLAMCFAALAQTNEVTKLPVANSLASPELLKLLIAVIVPLIVAGVKWVAPKLPSAVIPPMAIALGALSDYLGSLLGFWHGSAVSGLLLGAAGIGVREAADQLRRLPGNAAKAILISAGLLQLTACANMSATDQQRAISAAKIAAYLGTSEYLLQKPQDRPAFVLARDQLKVIENSETVDLATLLAIIQKLPVKELKSSHAQIIVTTATIVISDYAGSLPADRLNELKPLAAALRQGLDLALQ